MNVPKRFGDLSESDDEDGTTMMQKEWSKVDVNMRNSGVREGLETSHDSVIQEGFNSAFKSSLKMAMAGGRLQGGLSALLSYPHASLVKREETTQEESCSTKILQQLVTYNSDLMANIPTFFNPEVSTLQEKPASSFNEKLKDASATNESKDIKCLISCEDVCSNKTHFWSQLKNFKTQAHSLGVFIPND